VIGVEKKLYRNELKMNPDSSGAKAGNSTNEKPPKSTK
jgi:hypothetical protein